MLFLERRSYVLIMLSLLQRGEVFQATLRVNAHNRLEAYCTIEGVPTDELISVESLCQTELLREM